VRETRESGKKDFEVGIYVMLSISMEDKNGITTSSRMAATYSDYTTL
jgi:hypothetical protein